MKRRIRWTALVLAVCLLALTGCAQQRDTMTLRVCLDSAPATLDPAMAATDAERTVVSHLFENLMKLSRGENGSIQAAPAVAKSYAVEDNLDDVDAVFNFEVPEENEYYIHRIGRTGRARKHGVAYTLLSDFPSRMRLDDIARNTRSQIIPAVLGEDGQVTPAENKSK